MLQKRIIISGEGEKKKIAFQNLGQQIYFFSFLSHCLSFGKDRRRKKGKINPIGIEHGIDFALEKDPLPNGKKVEETVDSSIQIFIHSE
jgi:hypothetical protein